LEARHLCGGLWLLRPKSRRGWREIPLPGPVLRQLAAWCETHPGEPDGLVFARADGRPVDPSVDNRRWHDALDAAGVESLPLHDARHTTATLLAELQVADYVRKAILGHADGPVTEIYTHASAESVRGALGEVAGLLEAA
jgi:integrase